MNITNREFANDRGAKYKYVCKIICMQMKKITLQPQNLFTHLSYNAWISIGYESLCFTTLISSTRVNCVEQKKSKDWLQK